MPLTKEEKKLRKAQRKEEKKRKAEEKKVQLQVDYLTREMQYGDLTILRHEKKWKEMLMKISLPRMRQELEFAWHNFERVVDSKDFIISLLMDEINAAEEQYLIGIRNHIENIDNAIDAYKRDIYALKTDYERTVDNIVAEGQVEVNKLNSSHGENEQYFKMMLFGQEEARKDFLKTVMGDYMSRLDEEAVRYSDITARLKMMLEDKLDVFWKQTEKFLSDFKKQTTERNEQYNALNEADVQMHSVLAAQKTKISKSQDRIKGLKTEYNDLVYLEGHRIKELLNERQYYVDAFWALKTRLLDEKNTDCKNLTLLSIESNDIIQYLDNIKKKGERILGMAAVCRKLETQKEKILPFPAEMPEDEENEKLTQLQQDFEFNLDDLMLFWQRVAQADAIRLSMQEESVCLKKKNDILKEKIHYYCECLNCSAHEELERKRRERDELLVVLDANQELAKYSESNLK